MSCNKHYPYVYRHTHSLQLAQLIHLDTQSNTYHPSQLSAYLHLLTQFKGYKNATQQTLHLSLSSFIFPSCLKWIY